MHTKCPMRGWANDEGTTSGRLRMTSCRNHTLMPRPDKCATLTPHALVEASGRKPYLLAQGWGFPLFWQAL